MPDPFDPAVETIFADLGWTETFEAWETVDGTDVPEDLTGVAEIRVEMQRRTARGEAAADPVAASLTGETVAVTDAAAGQYEVQLPASAFAAAPAGTWDVRIHFERAGESPYVVYVGVRELRIGWGE